MHRRALNLSRAERVLSMRCSVNWLSFSGVIELLLHAYCACVRASVCVCVCVCVLQLLLLLFPCCWCRSVSDCCCLWQWWCCCCYCCCCGQLLQRRYQCYSQFSNKTGFLSLNSTIPHPSPAVQLLSFCQKLHGSTKSHQVLKPESTLGRTLKHLLNKNCSWLPHALQIYEQLVGVLSLVNHYGLCEG